MFIISTKEAAIALLVLITFEAILVVNSAIICSRDPVTNTHCGLGYTGRPRCGRTKRCGNVDGVCYCDCYQLGQFKCKQTGLGWAWNNGAKYLDGTYRFNGVRGDGKHYVC